MVLIVVTLLYQQASGVCSRQISRQIYVDLHGSRQILVVVNLPGSSGPCFNSRQIEKGLILNEAKLGQWTSFLTTKFWPGLLGG